MRRLLTLLTALAVGLTVLSFASPANAALAPGVTQTVLASNPTAYPSKTDYRIHEEMTRIMNGIPRGGSFTWSAWNLTYKPFADAGIRACRDRGVKAYVVQKGGSGGTTLASMRNACAPQGNWRICRSVTAAGTNNSCLGTIPSGSTMHDKSFTASSSNGRPYVSIFGTTNMTLHGYEHNQMVVTTGDVCIYNALRTHNAEMRALRRNANFADTAKGNVSCAGSDIRMRFTPSTSDIQAEELATYGAFPGCYVEATMRFFDGRPAVVSQLIRLDRAGCRVTVTSDSISRAHVDQLHRGGVTVRKTERIHTLPSGAKITTRMHDKGGVFYVLRNGKRVKLAWTGSLNQTGNSLTRADETFGILDYGPTVALLERSVGYLQAIDYKHPFVP